MSIPLAQANFGKSADPFEAYHHMERAIKLTMTGSKPPLNEDDAQEFLGNLAEAFEVLKISPAQQTELLGIVTLKAPKGSALEDLTHDKIVEITHATEGRLETAAKHAECNLVAP